MNAILVIILQYEWGTPDIVLTYKMCSYIYMYNVLDNQIIPQSYKEQFSTW